MRKVLSLMFCGVMVAGLVSNNHTAASINTSKNTSSSTPSSISTSTSISSKEMLSPEAVAAESYIGSSTSNEAMTESLEKVLKIVKGRIAIPKEYSEFDYYYDNWYGQEASWNLSWRRTSDSSSIQINCDAAGNIISYRKYNFGQKEGSVPTYLKKELVTTAEKFVKQIAPSIVKKLELVTTEYEGIYSGNYAYTFHRKENGISLPDNYVVISVNSVTGEVQSANISWVYDTKVPSGVVKLTKEDGAEIIKKNLAMDLVYRVNYNGIYDSVTGEYSKKAFLVYQPNKSYISIDAKTGEVYLTRSEWVEKTSADNMDSAKEESAMDAGGRGETLLTEEEIAKLAELEALISKEKAIETVTSNKNLHIDKNLISYNATLNKAYGGNSSKNSYVWNISLNDSRPNNYEKAEDNYRAYAYATVDAKTGKILSFQASIKSNYDENTNKWKEVKIKYDKKAAQEILEKFLKAQVKDRYNKSKFSSDQNGYVAFYNEGKTPIYGGYSFQYNRYNEGIEFPYNGIQGSVDGVTGKIYSYNTNWDDEIVFESPKSAMTADQAFDRYISNEGYQLVYEVNEINEYDPNYKGSERYYENSESYTLKKEIRLVYRPDVTPSYISPFSGEQLNYDGSLYQKTQAIVYNDIPDTKENRAILLLADMNIGFEGGSFQAKKSITAEEFKGLLDKTAYSYGRNEQEKDVRNSSLVTREEAASEIISRLELNRIAALKGIYTTGYEDESSIKQEYLGAVALAKGFGLMEAEADNYFNPKNTLTREEAVDVVLGFVRVWRDGIY